MDEVERKEDSIGVREDLSWLGLECVHKYEYGYILVLLTQILLILLPNKVFMRDADQVEAWISTQESFIAGDDYGVSGACPTYI